MTGEESALRPLWCGYWACRVMHWPSIVCVVKFLLWENQLVHAQKFPEMEIETLSQMLIEILNQSWLRHELRLIEMWIEVDWGVNWSWLRHEIEVNWDLNWIDWDHDLRYHWGLNEFGSGLNQLWLTPQSTSIHIDSVKMVWTISAKGVEWLEWMNEWFSLVTLQLREMQQSGFSHMYICLTKGISYMIWFVWGLLQVIWSSGLCHRGVWVPRRGYYGLCGEKIF